MTAQEFLQRAARRGDALKIITLWEGRWEDLLEYPSPSEADLALCSYIAQETGPDRDAIDGLFRQSGLYRTKWDDPHHSDGRTYAEGTIDVVLNARTPQPSTSSSGPGATSLGKCGVRQLFRTATAGTGTVVSPAKRVAGPYFVAGAITKVDGKAKSAGKTTLALDAARCVLTGQPFLGYPTEPGAVVYLTEQTEETFAIARRRAGLLDHPHLHYLCYHDVMGQYDWAEIVEGAGAMCGDAQAGLLVIDTIHQFAGLEGETENQAGAALKVIKPLQALIGTGVAVALLAHERKGGGDIGESGRGSSAFTGVVDTVLQLTRGEGQGQPNRRTLNAISRLDDVPEQLIIERRAVDAFDPAMAHIGVPAEYIFVSVARNEAALGAVDDAALLAALPQNPSAALSINELKKSRKMSRSVLQNRLDRLQQAGLVHRVGGGKKNDPYRFYAGGNSAGTPIPGGTQH